MNPILLIDKPSGITSFDVIRQLRRKLGIKKMGHAGTLDPLATGLLIIATGPATKQISNYMNLDKEYEALIEFGKVSNTYDAVGPLKVLEWSCQILLSKIFKKILKLLLESFSKLLRHFLPSA